MKTLGDQKYEKKFERFRGKICIFRLELVFGVWENRVCKSSRKENLLIFDMKHVFWVFSVKNDRNPSAFCLMLPPEEINNLVYSNRDICAAIHKTFMSWHKHIFFTPILFRESHAMANFQIFFLSAIFFI